MKVTVKDLSANIELKNAGMELEIRDPDGTFKGDLVITSTSLIWCEGKTKRENGAKISWKKFIELANSPTPFAAHIPTPVKVAATKPTPVKKAAKPK